MSNSPWNKGLTKETDERVNNSAKKSALTRNRLNLSKGKNNPMYGKKQKTEAKNKIRQANVGKNNPCYGRTGNANPMFGKINDKHPAYKGDDASNATIHGWVKKIKGKASNYKCVDCDKQAKNWSNKDHLYKRNLDDYLPRCISCHRKYDIKNNSTLDK